MGISLFHFVCSVRRVGSPERVLKFLITPLLKSSGAIRVFPAKNNWTPTDDLAFVGKPPDPKLFEADPLPLDRSIPVYVSVTFSWHKEEGKRLQGLWLKHFDNVYLGGVAFGDIGDEFTPGRFLKTGCTITSRGCTKRCGWCLVPQLSGGKIRELQHIKPGWIVQDDNLLATSDHHLKRVFEMLKEQDRNIFFNGGLDKHFLKESHRLLFDSIKIGELWFACDVTHDIPWLERAASILDGISLRRRRCYTMIGFDPDESVTDAERRIEKVFALDFMPFCQLYQPVTGPKKEYSEEWRNLRRKWARPAAYMPRKVTDETAIPRADTIRVSTSST